mgnify:FL=1
MTLLMTILFLACEKEEKTTVWVYHPQDLWGEPPVPLYIKDDPNLQYFQDEEDCRYFGRTKLMLVEKTYECIEIPYETFYRNLK